MYFKCMEKQNLYGGGTAIKLSLKGNGIEQKILLEQIKWSEDDKEPGQIRFRFPKPGQKAKVSVMLYVQNGFQVPEQGEEVTPNLTGEAAESMIARSLLSLGNPFRMKKVIEKSKTGRGCHPGFYRRLDYSGGRCGAYSPGMLCMEDLLCFQR